MTDPFTLMREGRHPEALESVRNRPDFDWGNEFVRSVSSFYDPYERRFGEDVCKRVQECGIEWMVEQASRNKGYYERLGYGNFYMFSDRELKNIWKLDQTHKEVELTAPNRCVVSSLKLILDRAGVGRTEWEIVADYARYPDSGILGIFDPILYENGSRLCVMGYRRDNSPVRARELVFADLGYMDELLTYKGEIRPMWIHVPSIDSYTSETGWLPVSVPAHSRSYDGVHIFAKCVTDGILLRSVRPNLEPGKGFISEDNLYFARLALDKGSSQPLSGNIISCDQGIVDKDKVFLTLCDGTKTRLVKISNMKTRVVTEETEDITSELLPDNSRAIFRLGSNSEVYIVPSSHLASDKGYSAGDLFGEGMQIWTSTVPDSSEVAAHLPRGSLVNAFAQPLLNYYTCKMLNMGLKICLLVSPVRYDGANEKMAVISVRSIHALLSLANQGSLEIPKIKCEYPVCIMPPSVAPVETSDAERMFRRGMDIDPENFMVPSGDGILTPVHYNERNYDIPLYGIPSMRITKTVREMMESVITDRVTVISGFVNMNRFQKRDKSLEEFKRAARHLMKQRLPMVLFADKEICDFIVETRERYGLLEYTRIVPMEVEDLPYIHFLEKLNDSRFLEQRSYKDTPLYSVVTNSKIHFIGKVAESNPFNSDYLAWVDFGLAHANSVDQMTRALLSPPKYEDRLIIPTTGIRNNHERAEYYRYIDGYICCGFMVGKPEVWKWFQKEHHLEYEKSVAEGFVANEESIGTRVMMRNPARFDTRASLYENLFINRNALVRGMYYIQNFIGREGGENPAVRLLWERQQEEHWSRFSVVPRHFTDFN